VDWVFFSSPKSVYSVLNQVQLPATLKVATLGRGTKKILEQYGVKPDFVGRDSDTSIVARTFLKELKSERVWLPKSSRSLNRIEGELPESQVVAQVTYQTTPISSQLRENHDIVVFTSPSNVEGYLLENRLSSKQHIIAIGETTASYITQRYSGLNVQISAQPTLDALVRLVLSVLNALK